MATDTAGPAVTRWQAWRSDAQAILALAWPVLVGQLAVLGFSTVDTLLASRASPEDLAALAVGSAAYITIFIGLMGAVLALGPIVGQLRGAGRLAEAGHQMHQGVWLALALSVPGCAALWWPDPFIELAQVHGPVAAKARSYLGVLAAALPASLLFTVFRSFSTAVSRPKPVMVLQLAGLALKVPLSALFVFGLAVPWLGLTCPALGVQGCAWATALVMWAQAVAAWWLLRTDAQYRPYEPPVAHLRRPHGPSLAALLRLGLPIAASLLIEVTGFSFMAVFIARLGTTPVAAHQIAGNVIALLYMVPLALGNAASTLAAQAIGAGRLATARRIGWHGLELAGAIALTLATLLWALRTQVAATYTADPAVGALAATLLGWVALMHLADASQAVAAFVLRAWRIATLPMLVYAIALWGVGLGGGYLLAFGRGDWQPLGAAGFWMASTAGLFIAALALAGLLAHILMRSARSAAPE